MTGIEHMSVSTAVHNDFGAGTRGRAVIEVTGISTWIDMLMVMIEEIL